MLPMEKSVTFTGACANDIIAPQITSILNMSIDQSVFPDKLKKAQVTPAA
jgi:hypothetical protein